MGEIGQDTGQDTERCISDEKQIENDSVTEEQRDGGRRKRSFYWRVVLFLVIINLVLNILARIPAVCDIYTDRVFWIWTETYGRITGIFPVSVGEILLILAINYVLIWLLSLILFIFLHKKTGFRKYFHAIWLY